MVIELVLILLVLTGTSLGFVFEAEIPRGGLENQNIAQNDLFCFNDGSRECITTFGRREGFARGIYARRSSDGGKTWGDEIEVENFLNGNAVNQRLSCSNNLCAIVYVSGTQLRAKYSFNRGQTWQTSRFDGFSVNETINRSCDVSCFEIDGSFRVRCLATVLDGTIGQYRILASNDNGVSFQSVFTFTPVSLGLDEARLKCLDRSFCVAVFGGTNQGIYRMRTISKDITGSQWFTPSKIGNSPDSNSDILRNGAFALLPDLEIASDRRVVIVAHIVTGSSVNFIETSISNDSGINFGSFRTLFSVPNSVENVARPALACSEAFATCFVSWESFPALSFAVSTDLGQNFGQRKFYENLPTPSLNVPQFSFTELAFAGSRCLAVFQGIDYVPNRETFSLLTAAIDLDESTTSPTTAPTVPFAALTDDEGNANNYSTILIVAVGIGSASVFAFLIYYGNKSNNRNSRFSMASRMLSFPKMRTNHNKSVSFMITLPSAKTSIDFQNPQPQYQRPPSKYRVPSV